MVDVGNKNVTSRVAITEGFISLEPNTLDLILQGGHKKGDVLGIARIAGIMASKQTANLIPLCHPISLTKVAVNFEIDEKNHFHAVALASVRQEPDLRCDEGIIHRC